MTKASAPTSDEIVKAVDDAAERRDASLVEQRLKDVTTQREKIQVQIKEHQAELERLFHKGVNKPREKLSDLEDEIAELERERTKTSLDLKDEREILRKIHRVEKKKREVEDFERYDHQIKQKKEQVSQLRDLLKQLSARISQLRVELSAVKQATDLGCSVKDLMGMKIDCPPEKLGKIIGKKGSHMKEIMERAKVSVNISRGDKSKSDGNNSGNGKEKDAAAAATSTLRIMGPLSSLDAAMSDIDKLLSTVQRNLEVPEALVSYLTSKHIAALPELRERHPDIYVDVNRKSKTKIRVEGVPEDIDSFQRDVQTSFNITERELQVRDRESSLIIGKQGANVDKLVQKHQASITVERKGSSDNGSGDGSDASASPLVRIAGPVQNVVAAVEEIEELLANHRDDTRHVRVDKNIRSVLLVNGGAGIQQLHKKVNATLAQRTFGTTTNIIEDPLAAATSAGFIVTISMSDNSVVVRGKSMVLQSAVELVEAEVRALESAVVRINVDSFAIPAIIGKGGTGIKKLLEGTKAVNIEVDRASGEVTVCGLNSAELEQAAAAVRLAVQENQVKRIDLDPSTFSIRHRDIVRSKTFKDISEIAFLGTDDPKSQIVLRGNEENLEKAYALVQSFLEKNYVDELNVTSNDLGVLLAGGKESKIVKLSKELGVQLNCDRDRLVVVVRGEVSKVKAARENLDHFLHGGDGIVVTKIPIDEQLQGIVIGKAGKKKAELERNHGNVSITVQGKEKCVTIRGTEKNAEECRIAIMKLLATARVTETVKVTKEQHDKIVKGNVARQIFPIVPVQISVTESAVTLRGFKTDVRDAVALLKEKISGTYESRLEFESDQFSKLRNACRDSTHFTRIERECRVKLKLDSVTQSVLVRGKRQSVKDAKLQLLKILDFLFPSRFANFKIPGPLMSTLGQSQFLAETSALSGADVRLDRDIESILVFSANSEKMEKASAILKPKIAESEKLVFVLQLDSSEDWIVSAVIGKGGKRIKALRKETGCNVEVVSNEQRLVVTGDAEAKVTKARAALTDIVEKERGQCAFVDVPETSMRAFIGRSGAHITEFSKTHGVEVQIMKGQSSKVRITGDEESVTKAKEALIEWLRSRDQEREEVKAEHSMSLRRDQIPTVIGNKGSVIRSLESEFGCSLQIDRDDPRVIVRGGSHEKREATIRKINDILQNGADDSLNFSEHSTHKPVTKPDKTRVQKIGNGKKPSTTPPTGVNDFPALKAQARNDDESGKSETDNYDPQSIPNLSTQSWASVVTVPASPETDAEYNEYEHSFSEPRIAEEPRLDSELDGGRI